MFIVHVTQAMVAMVTVHMNEYKGAINTPFMNSWNGNCSAGSFTDVTLVHVKDALYVKIYLLFLFCCVRLFS